ncbi:MAG TPA: CbtA family protein [Baekduia sp.]|uniref:CbtA family protein n=1 Tax=Baekduia sp. TaxID=2600305 RepID=UPI002D77B9D3|nr:CbtA family protein [Baekduia sp.]HET6508073.1 CbtA family protein [Baekduia sp.]
MVRSLLIRGMLVGAVAGVLAFAFALIFGEPQVGHAIDFEDYLAKMHHDPAEAEIVSRGVQRTWGLLTGTLAMGVALGGLFSLAYAWAYGRIGNGKLGPRATSALLALAAYLTIVIVPFTKYPANPPTVGNPDTIGRRTVLYFLMIVISLAAAIAAGRIRRQLLPALGAWNAAIVAFVAFVVVIAVAQLILPVVHETPQGFPADVLYRFRLASLGINATIWLVLGLGFGAAAERLLSPAARRAPAAAPAAS